MKEQLRLIATVVKLHETSLCLINLRVLCCDAILRWQPAKAGKCYLYQRNCSAALVYWHLCYVSSTAAGITAISHYSLAIDSPEAKGASSCHICKGRGIRPHLNPLPSRERIVGVRLLRLRLAMRINKRKPHSDNYTPVEQYETLSYYLWSEESLS